MEESAPRKVRPARIAEGAPVPDEIRDKLASLAQKYPVSPQTLEERFRRMEGYDLIRERFRERPDGERWEYILLILEERLKDGA